MECNNVREELVAYIDAELSSMGKHTIEAHLADCKECAAEHDKLKATIESTHKVGTPPACAELVGNITGTSVCT